MKERPIIMSDNHPKLILAGAKTQTRRVIKPEPVYDPSFIGGWVYKRKGQTASLESFNEHRYLDIGCPFGQIGDRLWVRENLCFDINLKVVYQADFSLVTPPTKWEWKGAIRPSIFMPRWASRILLEITEVRVERVQEITEEDAKAEGVDCCLNSAYTDYRHHFMVLWDSLNAKRGYGWGTNPWVWVLCFKVAQ